MVYKIVLSVFCVYSIVYTCSFIIYEYRNKNTLSVLGNTVFAVIAAVLFIALMWL